MLRGGGALDLLRREAALHHEEGVAHRGDPHEREEGKDLTPGDGGRCVRWEEAPHRRRVHLELRPVREAGLAGQGRCREAPRGQDRPERQVALALTTRRERLT
eukprot:scaffold65762_cov60-Phaeocystis_antarctica.AAC.10